LRYAACLCKELGITVFGIYAAHSITRALASCPRGSFFIPRASVNRLSCVLASSLGLLLARLWVNGEQTKATFNILANAINVEEERLIRWMSYAHVHAWYLWKLVWPSWFSYDYGFNTIPVITDLTDPRNLLSALAYATVMIGLTKGFRDIQHSPLVMCIAFGVIPFVPASNIFFPVGTVVAERLLYFPSVGFCLIVGYTANQFVSSLDRMDDRMMAQAQDHTSFQWRSFSGPCVRRLSATLVAFLLSTSMYKSIVRNAEWQSEETLFTAAVGVVPENVKVLNNAAKVLLNKDSKRALQLARASVAMMPDHIEGQSNLGLAFTFEEPKKLLAIRHMVKSFAYTSTEAAVRHLRLLWPANGVFPTDPCVLLFRELAMLEAICTTTGLENTMAVRQWNA
jgi:protein O-mannosyl-transferase